jgi:hypothetical protein
LVLWFLLSWIPYLLFYAGSYRYGADVRFVLLSLPPIALLAGRGLEMTLQSMQGVGLGRWGRDLMLLILGATLLLALPLIRATSEEGWQARDAHRAAVHFAAELPEDAIVMTHTPSIFHLAGKNAAQLFLADGGREGWRTATQADHPGGVYLHWGFWCNRGGDVQRQLCERVFSEQPTETHARLLIRGEPYALERVVP